MSKRKLVPHKKGDRQILDELESKGFKPKMVFSWQQPERRKIPLDRKILWAVLGAMIAGNVAIMVMNTQHRLVSREQVPAGYLIEQFKP